MSPHENGQSTLGAVIVIVVVLALAQWAGLDWVSYLRALVDWVQGLIEAIANALDGEPGR